MPEDEAAQGADRWRPLDPVLSERARLAIGLFLAVRGSARSKSLQDRLHLTSGNLAAHIKRMESVGYVRVDRTFEDMRARVVHITPSGLIAVRDFLAQLERSRRELQPEP
jgi:DNA-binding MarR family transcriptional regulator